MKKSIFILAAVALLAMVSCNNKAKENQNQESAATVALSVDDILAEGDSLVGKTVTVEGVCTHICKHGGKKLFMMGTDDTKMLRAEACELGSFPAEVVNSLVSVTGTLEEDRIDEATIQRMEEQYKNQSGEKHGDGEAGCESEKEAAGQADINTFEGRIQNFRERLAKAKEAGKDYFVMSYHINTTSYEIKN